MESPHWTIDVVELGVGVGELVVATPTLRIIPLALLVTMAELVGLERVIVKDLLIVIFNSY
jgi:hypothetical protein